MTLYCVYGLVFSLSKKYRLKIKRSEVLGILPDRERNCWSSGGFRTEAPNGTYISDQ
jgi:hypothetical protein